VYPTKGFGGVIRGIAIPVSEHHHLRVVRIADILVGSPDLWVLLKSIKPIVV